MVIYLEVLHDNIRLQDCFSVVLVTNWHVGCGQCSICRSIQQYIGSPALTQLHIFLACPFEAFIRVDGSFSSYIAGLEWSWCCADLEIKYWYVGSFLRSIYEARSNIL